MIEIICETTNIGYGTDMELPEEAQERWEEEDYPCDDDIVDWSVTTVTIIGEHEKEIKEFVQNMDHHLRWKILDDFDIDHEGLNNVGSFLSWNDSGMGRPDLSPFSIVKRYDRDCEKMQEERVSARFRILHASIAT